jgi:tRNA(fMet)-specific endonuclease VapC
VRYTLDTDICIYAINERPPRVLRALRDHPAAGLGVSSITASELHYGEARTGSTRNAEALGRFLASLEVRLDGGTIARIYQGAITRWRDPAILAQKHRAARARFAHHAASSRRWPG